MFKKSKLSKQALVNKLDAVFSKYIRAKDAKNGVVKCVTCRKYLNSNEAHAGHYIGRRHMATRFDEKNVHVQCVFCNTFNEGAKDEYSLYLVNAYGPGILEELNRKKHMIAKFETFQLELMITEYKKKLSELE